MSTCPRRRPHQWIVGRFNKVLTKRFSRFLHLLTTSVGRPSGSRRPFARNPPQPSPGSAAVKRETSQSALVSPSKAESTPAKLQREPGWRWRGSQDFAHNVIFFSGWASFCMASHRRFQPGSGQIHPRRGDGMQGYLSMDPAPPARHPGVLRIPIAWNPHLTLDQQQDAAIRVQQE